MRERSGRSEARGSRYPLGVVDVVFEHLALSHRDISTYAAQLGFEYLDVTVPLDEILSLPIGERFSRVPRAGFTTGAPRAPTTWEEAVASYRAAPGACMEPTYYGIVRGVDAVRAFVAEVPGLRISLDTGHVAGWGEDPADLVDLADHVQLKQASRGVPQARTGDVDFSEFLTRLRAVGYQGGCSIEYCDRPQLGYPLDDPIGHALDLAEHVRPLLVGS